MIRYTLLIAFAFASLAHAGQPPKVSFEQAVLERVNYFRQHANKIEQDKYGELPQERLPLVLSDTLTAKAELWVGLCKGTTINAHAARCEDLSDPLLAEMIDIAGNANGYCGVFERLSWVGWEGEGHEVIATHTNKDKVLGAIILWIGGFNSDPRKVKPHSQYARMIDPKWTHFGAHTGKATKGGSRAVGAFGKIDEE